MPILDRLFSIGTVRNAIWRLWYPYLTKRLRQDDVVFLNYAFDAEPAMDLPFSADDARNRACIQLYHYVGTQVPLAGKSVLEVSCGHGGGASYLTRTQGPASYVGLDLNPTGIAFCRQRHAMEGLTFVQGNAMQLPFPDGHFDAVVNVEASHCYPSFPGFLAEVKRVLKPGGHLLYADFRFSEDQAAWNDALEQGLLTVIAKRDISAEVLRGMECNSAKSEALVDRFLPKFLHKVGRDFAGVKGSRIYNALQSGELSYRSYCFRNE